MKQNRKKSVHFSTYSNYYIVTIHNFKIKGVFNINIDNNAKHRARNVNIADYLTAKGEKLIKEGDRYRHSEHSSLVFDGSWFHWNKRNINGNPIDFVMLYYGLSFPNAIKDILNPQYNATSSNNTATSDVIKNNYAPFDFANIKLSDNMRRVWAYLCKTRGIDRSILQELINSKHLYQELGNGNMIFPIYDEDNTIVGAERIGILSEHRFKSIEKGSNSRYGFNIGYTDNSEYTHILFFEGIIDLLSFINISKDNNEDLTGRLLVSMAGLKKCVVDGMFTQFSSEQKPLRCIFCVDNDTAGKTFLKDLENEYYFETIFPDPVFKDWNEQLQHAKNINNSPIR